MHFRNVDRRIPGFKNCEMFGGVLPDKISKFTSEVFTGRLYFNPPLYLVLTFFCYLLRTEI